MVNFQCVLRMRNSIAHSSWRGQDTENHHEGSICKGKERSLSRVRLIGEVWRILASKADLAY